MSRYIALSLLLAASPLLGQNNRSQSAPAAPSTHDTANLYTRKSLNAVRIDGNKPTIDGKLDDAIWRTAPAGRDFIQYKPNPGDAASQKTEIFVAYDDAAVYIGARMFDTHPDSIVAQLSRRDNDVYSEWILVALDSYFDRRTAFVFGVNPKGVKLDKFLFDDTNDDDSWDAVWDAEARIDSLGWTAEMRIPLSQLRFSPGKGGQNETVWGFEAVRLVARRNEESFWSPVRKDANALVSAFGDLHGISGLKPPRRMEVLPYSMSRVVRAPGEAANPFFHANDGAIGAGADVKLGVSSSMTLTGTINPDFGQIEADPSVVNLTAYETFFPEKRPFFVEGFDIFRAGFGVGDGDGGNEGLFYSRRIGRAPQGDVSDDAVYSNYPQAATILGAAKLSGKTKDGWSVGALSALTDRESAEFVDGVNHRGETVVEPLTHYGMARVIKDFNKGQDAIGAVFTATNRDLPDNLKYLRANAYAGGATGRHRWQNGNYELSGFLYGSSVNGDTSAINLTQRSSARYFQRPDNTHVTYDPTRTSLNGAAAGFQVGKMGGGNWRYIVIANARTPGFETNDLGYMQNADQLLEVEYVGYRAIKPTKHLNAWNINVNQWNGWTFGGEHVSTGGNINGHVEFKNTAEIWGGISRDQSVLDPGALRGGPALRTPGRFGMFGGYDSNERKRINYWLDMNYSNEDGTDGHSLGFHPGLRIRASNQLEIRLNPGMNWHHTPWQYVDAVDASGATHYVFGALDQVTTSLTVRTSYTVSSTLSLQFYAEPFISAGDFSDFKEVANPRATSFGARFKPYAYGDNPDFNYRALRTNMVARWEYKPGSALFLVWSQGREVAEDFGDFRFSRDTNGLFNARPTNVLMVKASYWLGL